MNCEISAESEFLDIGFFLQGVQVFIATAADQTKLQNSGFLTFKNCLRVHAEIFNVSGLVHKPQKWDIRPFYADGTFTKAIIAGF